MAEVGVGVAVEVGPPLLLQQLLLQQQMRNPPHHQQQQPKPKVVGSPRPQERGVAAEVKVGVAAEVKGGVAAEVMGGVAEVGAVGTLHHRLLGVKGSPLSLGQQISKVITIGFKYYKVTKNQTLSFLGIAINLITYDDWASRAPNAIRSQQSSVMPKSLSSASALEMPISNHRKYHSSTQDLFEKWYTFINSRKKDSYYKPLRPKKVFHRLLLNKCVMNYSIMFVHVYTILKLI